MQITTKTEYAVRALAEMALLQKENPVPIRKICEQQTLPLKYIEQLFRKLKRKGMIRSVHGAKGGYFINKELAEISILDIMVAVEDNKISVQCDRTAPEKPTYCSGIPCSFYGLWSEVTDHMNNYLDTISLQSVVDRIKETR